VKRYLAFGLAWGVFTFFLLELVTGAWLASAVAAVIFGALGALLFGPPNKTSSAQSAVCPYCRGTGRTR
jgi:hypothetical protein